jgi:hypothetical protein
MSVQVAINGFGRIGRGFLRSALERDANIEVVAVNDVADAATLAALLRRDSVYGRFPGTVTAGEGTLAIDGSDLRALSEAEPSSLPWGELGVDVVVESTGRFRTRAAAAQHLDAGARKVIISAPAKGSPLADATVVLGVNFDEVYDPDAHQAEQALDGGDAPAAHHTLKRLTPSSLAAAGNHGHEGARSPDAEAALGPDSMQHERGNDESDDRGRRRGSARGNDRPAPAGGGAGQDRAGHTYPGMVLPPAGRRRTVRARPGDPL